MSRKVGTLNDAQRLFCQRYVENGQNGTQAYRDAYPRVSPGTARTGAAELLAKPHVAAHVAQLRRLYWADKAMEADEAVGRVAAIARASIRDFWGEDGQPLPPRAWPPALAQAVKSYKAATKGRPAVVVLHDSLGALRLILEKTGAIKGVGGSLDVLAEAIMADRRAHGLDPPEEDDDAESGAAYH